MFVGWLLALHPSNMLVYLRDGSAQTRVRAVTLRYKLQIKLSTSPSHSMLTPGQPVPALTLQHQAPGKVATRVPIFKSLVCLGPGGGGGGGGGNPWRKRKLNPGSSAVVVVMVAQWWCCFACVDVPAVHHGGRASAIGDS